ncbi:MAG: hypothetical protein L6Q37_12640 [Bdellovibrionaceae bacterium]|nr:hypothetical protein [Pseudobdellovibrionaceae bacterium]NUM58735.1 hypothetical protein [Pseudobdellovibrionaceae bacterium]
MKNQLLNSLLSGIVTATLIYTPTTLAQNTAVAGAKQTKEIFNLMNSDGNKTYGDIWKKVSGQFPKDEAYQGAYGIFSLLANEKIPKTQVQEFDYKGKKAFKTIHELDGETVIIEYLLSENEMLKINGVTLSAQELRDDNILFKKLEHFKFVKKAIRKFKMSIFAQGYVPTFEAWKKMSKAQKAEYVLYFRELLAASQKVFKQPTSNKVVQRMPANVELFASYFTGETSYADNSTAVVDGAKLIGDRQIRERFLGLGETDEELNRTGPSCIISGMAGTWSSNGKGCSLSKNSAAWSSEETMVCRERESNPKKKKAIIACQSTLYIASDGGPVCADTSSPEFQQATHPDGVCDKQSKLDTVEDKYTFLKAWIKKIERTGVNVDPKLIKIEDGKLTTSDMETYKKVTSNLTKPLLDYIDSATRVCLNADKSEISADDLKKEDAKFIYNHGLKKTKKGKRSAKNDDPAQQNNACDGILKRAIKIRSLLSPQESGVVQSDLCSGWSPAGTYWYDATQGVCKCKVPYMNTKTLNLCVVGETPQSHVPVTTTSPAPATVDTVEANDLSTSTGEVNGCGFFSKLNPSTGGCDMAWGKIGLSVLGFLGGACLLEATTNMKVFGWCSHKRKPSSPLEYVTPLPGPYPTTTVTTTTTTTPTTAPRAGESTTNITIPSGAVDSVR